MLAEHLKTDVESILDFDLSLYDYQDPRLGGAFDEFIFSGRQDNLVSCFVATEAILGKGCFSLDSSDHKLKLDLS